MVADDGSPTADTDDPGGSMPDSGSQSDSDPDPEPEQNPDPDTDPNPDDINAAELLAHAGFDADAGVLTERQAEVLALREHGLRQSVIADRLGTSRANVSSVEASARTNVERARETVAFAEALSAPVHVEIPAGTDLYDAPKRVYDACDDAGVKVNKTAPDLMKTIGDRAGDAVYGREVRDRLFVTVGTDGRIRVR